MYIDEQAREEWVARTDGFERVKATLETTQQPTSAGDIADEALVSEKTARKYLQRLADLNAASIIQDERTTRYTRDTAWRDLSDWQTTERNLSLATGCPVTNSCSFVYRSRAARTGRTGCYSTMAGGTRTERSEDSERWRYSTVRCRPTFTG